ncbi:hypothetical protein [Bosea sp. BK604]|uniref:hypothetical protein n=1 Tax=Bosea sp. BK604 TaxID=2512180 RepID=UPI00105289EF|nr:hypothetical protein [Bosea sp. BK604]
MARTAAKVTQADIARVVRAVAQARVRAVIEILPDGTIRVIMNDEQALEAGKPIDRDEEIVL